MVGDRRVSQKKGREKTCRNRVRPLTSAGGAISSGAEKLEYLDGREMDLSSRNGLNPCRERKTQSLLCKSGKSRLIALSAATLAVLAFSASALAADIRQSGEQKNMKLVGHVNLQFRGSYQPNVI
jgi:hypothetical protein